MESKNKSINEKLFEIIKETLNHEYVIGLRQTQNLRMADVPISFDLADLDSHTFVDMVDDFKSTDRPDVLSKIRIKTRTITRARKNQKSSFIVVFTSPLGSNDREYFKKTLTSTNFLEYIILDIQNITELRKKNSLSVVDFLELDGNVQSNNFDNGSTNSLRAASSEQLIKESLNLNVWWLNADEQNWDYTTDKTEYYPIKTLTKNDKQRTRNSFNKFDDGDLFLAYQKAPLKQLFGVYIKVPSVRPADYAFILLHEFEKKPSWDVLVELADFRNSTIYSMSAQGSAYKVEDGLLVEILKLATDIHAFTESLEGLIVNIAKEFRNRTFKSPFSEGFIENEESPFSTTYDKINFQLDQVSDKDELGHAPVAKAFSRLIVEDIFSKNLEHSFVVHLQGEWGAGKSTFINLIKKELPDDWVFVEYNAWQNQHIRPPWWTLINQIYIQSRRNMMSLKETIHFSIREQFRRFRYYSNWQNLITFIFTLVFVYLLISNVQNIINIIGAPKKEEANNIIPYLSSSIFAISGIVGLIYTFSRWISTSVFINSSNHTESFVVRSKDPMGTIKKHYEEMVSNIIGKNNNRNLAIFIDDIDRCNKEYVIELMEGLQTLFKKKKVLFIIAGDKKWISTCFQNTYKDFQTEANESHEGIGDLFLHKMFQLTVRVPQVSSEMREKFWHNVIGYTEVNNKNQLTEADLTDDEITELKKDIQSKAHNWSDAKLINEIQEKYNLTGDTVSNLVIEKVNENNSEFIHILKDYHTNLDLIPRSMKRIANNYTMTRSTLIAERKSFDPNKIMRILLVEELYPFVMDWVKTEDSIEKIIDRFKGHVSKTTEINRFEALLLGSNDFKGGEMTIEDIKELKGL